MFGKRDPNQNPAQSPDNGLDVQAGGDGLVLPTAPRRTSDSTPQVPNC